MNTDETTVTKTTYTCPETGVVIDAQDLAGEYGSKDHSRSAWIRLILRKNAEHWDLQGDDLDGGDATLQSERHNRDIVISLWSGDCIVIDDGDLPEILDDLKLFCAQLRVIEDGHRIDWDGDNYAGSFSKEARAALAAVKELESKGLGVAKTFADYSEATVDAEEWLYESLHEMTADQLHEPGLAERLIKQELEDGSRLFGDVQGAIDEALADREDDEPCRTSRAAQSPQLDSGAAPD